MFCTKCGATVDENTQTCPGCGAQVRSAPVSQQQPPQTWSQGGANFAASSYSENLWVKILKVFIWVNLALSVIGSFSVFFSDALRWVMPTEERFGLLVGLLYLNFFGLVFLMVIHGLASDTAEIKYILKNRS